MKPIKVKDTGDTIFIIKDEHGNERYRIRPYSNHLCYVIDEWGTTKNRKTGEETWGWKEMECYPWDLYHAADLVKNRLIMNSNLTTDDIKELKKVITVASKNVAESIEESWKQHGNQSR